MPLLYISIIIIVQIIIMIKIIIIYANTSKKCKQIDRTCKEINQRLDHLKALRNDK